MSPIGSGLGGGKPVMRIRWILLLALLVWESVWTGRKLLTGEPGDAMALPAASLLAFEGALLLLTVRLGIALVRTPRRDARKLRLAALQRGQKASSGR